MVPRNSAQAPPADVAAEISDEASSNSSSGVSGGSFYVGHPGSSRGENISGEEEEDIAQDRSVRIEGGETRFAEPPVVLGSSAAVTAAAVSDEARRSPQPVPDNAPLGQPREASPDAPAELESAAGDLSVYFEPVQEAPVSTMPPGSIPPPVQMREDGVYVMSDPWRVPVDMVSPMPTDVDVMTLPRIAVEDPSDPLSPLSAVAVKVTNAVLAYCRSNPTVNITLVVTANGEPLETAVF